MATIPKNRYRVSITSECNMRCSYCHNEGNGNSVKWMNPNTLYDLIDYSRGLGLKEIRLTGGEPTIHPQIEEICFTLKNKYNLRVSLNTNLMNFGVICHLLEKNLVDHIVVGIDYFDGAISKHSSVGVPSKVILQRILSVKQQYPACTINISTVYTGDDYHTENLINFCIENKIRIKVLEIQFLGQGHKVDLKSIKEKYSIVLPWSIDELGEMNLYKDGKKVVSFFDSLCASKKCNICHSIQLRVLPDGTIKPCAFRHSGEFSIYDKDFGLRIAKYCNEE